MTNQEAYVQRKQHKHRKTMKNNGSSIYIVTITRENIPNSENCPQKGKKSVCDGSMNMLITLQERQSMHTKYII